MKTLLITGAAGNVGGHLRRELRATYRLRVSDIQPIHDLAPNETYMPGDVARLADMRRIVAEFPGPDLEAAQATAARAVQK